jgi:hypothetical protein
MENQLTKEQAIQIIEQVCSKYVGNLNEHQTIQMALNFIRTELLAEKELPKKE